MEKRALITGISGFVGPYLTAELERCGYTVFGLGGQPHEGHERYYVADIRDRRRVAEVMNEIAPMHIFHLAGISSPPFAEAHPALTFAVNVEGTRHLLDAATALVAPPQLLIVGSAQVYGEPEYLPIDETHPLKGTGAYAASRLRQEELARQYCASLPIVITRSFNHTGPGQPDAFVVPKIVKHAVEITRGLRDHIEIGNIEVKRDISDVRDVVRAYRLLLAQPVRGIVCNVSRGVSVALKEIIAYVKVLAQLEELPIMVNPALVRSDEIPDLCGSNRLLTSLIAWNPSVDYHAMLRNMYRYWKRIIP